MAGHDTQLLKGVLGLLLLQLIAVREDYGYALVLRLHELGFDELTEGAVYPALTRLETRGLLAARLVRSDAGPARKYYRLTKPGRDELQRASSSWADLTAGVAKAFALHPEET